MPTITTTTGLSRPTIHRMLQTSPGASFAEQNRERRRRHLGPVLFELGLAAPKPVDRLREIEPLLYPRTDVDNARRQIDFARKHQ